MSRSASLARGNAFEQFANHSGDINRRRVVAVGFSDRDLRRFLSGISLSRSLIGRPVAQSRAT